MKPEETTPPKPSILVVDDTHANLRFLSEILTMHNYIVRPVPDGYLALSSAKAALPDLILLDIMMPNISGYEICKQLKANDLTRDIPVIFISVKDEVLDKVTAFSIGGVDYITKPFQAEEVLARVKTHLDLRVLQKTLQENNIRLQQEILERKEAEKNLSAANKELQGTLQTLQKTQKYLIESEKMTKLGQLVASIAHELNTPLGAIRSSAEHLSTSLNQTLFEQLPEFFHSLTKRQQRDFWALLRTASQETSFKNTKEKRQLRKTLTEVLSQHQIDDARRVAEMLINIGFYGRVQPFLPLLSEPGHYRILEMAYKLSGLQKSSSALTNAVDKALKIIQSLKTYARYDRSGQLVAADIIRGIETVLTLYHNQLKQGIEIQRNYEEIPSILCYPDELIQVWTNLINNALHAMKNRGTIVIDVTQSNEQAIVAITDTGHGIPADIQGKIFEPFFTTKPSGEGNGLGLDIVKKIIVKHQGEISLESMPGKTTFRVSLPIIT